MAQAERNVEHFGRLRAISGYGRIRSRTVAGGGLRGGNRGMVRTAGSVALGQADCPLSCADAGGAIDDARRWTLAVSAAGADPGPACACRRYGDGLDQIGAGRPARNRTARSRVDRGQGDQARGSIRAGARAPDPRDPAPRLRARRQSQGQRNGCQRSSWHCLRCSRPTAGAPDATCRADAAGRIRLCPHRLVCRTRSDRKCDFAGRAQRACARTLGTGNVAAGAFPARARTTRWFERDHRSHSGQRR